MDDRTPPQGGGYCTWPYDGPCRLDLGKIDSCLLCRWWRSTEV